jgi:hypothetical protein
MKSAGLVPLMVSLKVAVASPLLVIVTVLLVEECPDAMVPKAKLVGTTLSGVKPVPLRATAGGPPLGSCATPIERVPLSAVSVLGLKVIHVTAARRRQKAASARATCYREVACVGAPYARAA